VQPLSRFSLFHERVARSAIVTFGDRIHCQRLERGRARGFTLEIRAYRGEISFQIRGGAPQCIGVARSTR